VVSHLSVFYMGGRTERATNQPVPQGLPGGVGLISTCACREQDQRVIGCGTAVFEQPVSPGTGLLFIEMATAHSCVQVRASRLLHGAGIFETPGCEFLIGAGESRTPGPGVAGTRFCIGEQGDHQTARRRGPPGFPP